MRAFDVLQVASFACVAGRAGARAQEQSCLELDPRNDGFDKRCVLGEWGFDTPGTDHRSPYASPYYYFRVPKFGQEEKSKIFCALSREGYKTRRECWNLVNW